MCFSELSVPEYAGISRETTGIGMARNFRRTWRYMGREFVISFTVAFLFFFFIFFVNQILVMAEEIFSKKVPLWDVIRLVAYSLPTVVALSFPFGSLVGALMAVGRLSSDNEVLAFNASGVPSRHLLLPMLLLGLLFSSVSFIMNDYFLPLGNIRFAEIYRRIIYTNPAVELEPHAIKRYENTVIITGGVEGKRIVDILIIDKSPEGNRRVITAQSATLAENSETRGVVSLTLEKVFSQVSFPKEGDRYDYFYSESMVYNILLKSITGVIGGLGPSQQSSADVWKQIQRMMGDQREKVRARDERVNALLYGLSSEIRAARQDVSADPSKLPSVKKNLDAMMRGVTAERETDVKDGNLQVYLIEFHRKFSVPAACLVFAFFAFPIGLMARRSGRTVGFGVGLFVSILYYGLLFAGQTFGARMELSPELSMWLPDLVIFGVGAIIFMVRTAR
jgi:lipopolysaccharide export system permease protein